MLAKHCKIWLPSENTGSRNLSCLSFSCRTAKGSSHSYCMLLLTSLQLNKMKALEVWDWVRVEVVTFWSCFNVHVGVPESISHVNQCKPIIGYLMVSPNLMAWHWENSPPFNHFLPRIRWSQTKDNCCKSVTIKVKLVSSSFVSQIPVDERRPPGTVDFKFSGCWHLCLKMEHTVTYMVQSCTYPKCSSYILLL
jgi:hypothetical protein